MGTYTASKELKMKWTQSHKASRAKDHCKTPFIGQPVWLLRARKKKRWEIGYTFTEVTLWCAQQENVKLWMLALPPGLLNEFCFWQKGANDICNKLLIYCLTLWRLDLKKCWTLISVLYYDVQMDQQTARDTKVLKFMQSLSRNLWLKPSGSPVILTQQSMGRNKIIKSGHLFFFFTFWRT